ncbi:uncharacterized protein LOC120336227 [Styela clava]|uniref:superoxide dismutase [Cu-Zn]-like n=1 Tax=Styela clava TaxID=7725 RepID=UPI0019392E63|nr:superoxide dismutase [Cu-Zn]-like [Styela clava]
MKLLILSCIVFVVVTDRFVMGDPKAATCSFGENRGKIHFMEKDNKIRVHVSIHNVPGHTYGMHVHQNKISPGATTCDGLGTHFNPTGDPNNDKGDLNPNGDKPLAASKSGHLHLNSYYIDTLTLDDAPVGNGIVGRSVVLHVDGKKFCCNIVRDTYVEANFLQH